MISNDNKSIAVALGSLLAILACIKLVLWPLLLKRRTTVRYRRVVKKKR